MKFRYVAKGKTNAKVYQGQTASTGDEVEFTGHFIDKAIANPDFEAAQPEKRAKKKTSRKKVTRRG